MPFGGHQAVYEIGAYEVCPRKKSSRRRSNLRRALFWSLSNEMIRYFVTGWVIESKSDFHTMALCLG
jgi:hypothetical protein